MSIVLHTTWLIRISQLNIPVYPLLKCHTCWLQSHLCCYATTWLTPSITIWCRSWDAAEIPVGVEQSHFPFDAVLIAVAVCKLINSAHDSCYWHIHQVAMLQSSCMTMWWNVLYAILADTYSKPSPVAHEWIKGVSIWAGCCHFYSFWNFWTLIAKIFFVRTQLLFISC